MYKITQAANMLGVSIHTLRYYEKEGLTPFVKRSKGVRIYDDKDIEVIRLIICLRDIDMPIKNIRDYMDLYMKGESTVEERRALMRQYCDFVERKITDTIETLKFTTEKIACFDEAVKDILTQRKDI
ncbi:MAG: MerR family transcriptional regulator [Oscillospiraceae bacterium]|nr:MerR family transcriptional regulator [Oscillospiraceae bacterium]